MDFLTSSSERLRTKKIRTACGENKIQNDNVDSADADSEGTVGARTIVGCCRDLFVFVFLASPALAAMPVLVTRKSIPAWVVGIGFPVLTTGYQCRLTYSRNAGVRRIVDGAEVVAVFVGSTAYAYGLMNFLWLSALYVNSCSKMGFPHVNIGTEFYVC